MYEGTAKYPSLRSTSRTQSSLRPEEVPAYGHFAGGGGNAVGGGPAARESGRPRCTGGGPPVDVWSASAIYRGRDGAACGGRDACGLTGGWQPARRDGRLRRPSAGATLPRNGTSSGVVVARAWGGCGGGSPRCPARVPTVPPPTGRRPVRSVYPRRGSPPCRYSHRPSSSATAPADATAPATASADVGDPPPTGCGRPGGAASTAAAANAAASASSVGHASTAAAYAAADATAAAAADTAAASSVEEDG